MHFYEIQLFTDGITHLYNEILLLFIIVVRRLFSETSTTNVSGITRYQDYVILFSLFFSFFFPQECDNLNKEIILILVDDHTIGSIK